MRWVGRRQSGNIEDRRGMRTAGAVGGGLGTMLLLLVVALVFGIDPRQILMQVPAGGGGGRVQPVSAEQEQMKEFVAVVLADTEDVWHQEFQQRGRRYRDPTLVLFNDAVDSACGFAGSAVGPFYCPEDEKVYIDLAFFEDLSSRYGANGDFAIAYVIGHEIGHHVQNQLGYSDRVHQMRERVSKQEYNRLSVRLELQADFLAGAYARHAQNAKNILEAGDLEEAIGAASAVGDDRLQREAQGHVVPDAFTHGTSKQRAKWFRKGFESGKLEDGDTFSIPYDSL
jgi:uncharacterized protein